MSESYDVHTHVGLDLGFYLAGWWPYASTAHELVGHLDRAGIDRAVCFPFTLPSAFDPYAFAAERVVRLQDGRVPFDRENEALIREVKRLGLEDRLLPFAMFDPARCVSEQLQRLESLVDSIAGLKTQSTSLQSPIRSLLGASADLMGFARDHDLPVLFHTAVHPEDRWAQAADCLEVAKAHPNVRFNLAHSLRFDAVQLTAAAELDNVWIDCAAHLIHCRAAREGWPVVATESRRVRSDYTSPAKVLEAVHAIVGDRYLWGSDHPYMSWCDDGIAGIYRYDEEADVLDHLPDAVRTSMTSTAPRRWLTGPG